MKSDPLSHCRSRLTAAQSTAADELLAAGGSFPLISYDAKTEFLTIRSIHSGVDRMIEIGPQGMTALVRDGESQVSLLDSQIMSPHTEPTERAQALLALEKQVARNYLGSPDLRSRNEEDQAIEKEAMVLQEAQAINARVIDAAHRTEMLLEMEIAELIPWAAEHPEWAEVAADAIQHVDLDAPAGRGWQLTQWSHDALPTLLEAGLDEQEIARINRDASDLALSVGQGEVKRIRDDTALSKAEKKAAYREILAEMRSTIPNGSGKPKMTATAFRDRHTTRQNIPNIPLAIHRQPDGGAVVWALCDDRQLVSLKRRLSGFYDEVVGPDFPSAHYVATHTHAEVLRNILLCDPLNSKIVRALEHGSYTLQEMERLLGLDVKHALDELAHYHVVTLERDVDPETGEVSWVYCLAAEDAIECLFEEVK